MKEEDKIDGLNRRHLAQILRRKTTQKSHGDKNKYSRKNNKDYGIDGLA